MLTLRDSECACMHKHTILQIISDQPPPFAANPQMVKWATCVSNHMCKGLRYVLSEAQGSGSIKGLR